MKEVGTHPTSRSSPLPTGPGGLELGVSSFQPLHLWVLIRVVPSAQSRWHHQVLMANSPSDASDFQPFLIVTCRKKDP